MSSDTHDLLLYLCWGMPVFAIAHFFIRRFWLTCSTVAVGCSVLNIGHENVVHEFCVRPCDVAFWLPMLFVYGIAVAFPVALVVGLPFHFIRRRRKTV
jgi:hypothetical protein